MKNVFLLFGFFLCALAAFAQAPQGINYQAIARDAGGNPKGDLISTVDFTIQNDTSNGSPVLYKERHFGVQPNQFGLFNLVIGAGQVQSGSVSFANIPWASGPKYLRVSIGTTAGKWQQMQSVPYAQYAEKTTLQAGNGISVDGNKITNTGDPDANDDLKKGDVAGGGLSGTYPNPNIGANAVGSDQIINGSITSADLAPGIIPSPVEIYIFEERYPHNTIPTTWSNTTNGTPLANAFNTRKVNTPVYPTTPNPSNVTLSPSTGQITFKPGVYLIQASAPAFVVSRHKLFLRDNSNNLVLLTGTDEFSNVTTNGHSRSFITGVLVVTGADKIARLDHWLGTTDVNAGGVELGPQNSASTPSINWNSISEVYTTILIQKIQ